MRLQSLQSLRVWSISKKGGALGSPGVLRPRGWPWSQPQGVRTVLNMLVARSEDREKGFSHLGYLCTRPQTGNLAPT